MASIRKCSKCGLDLTDTMVQACPICGARIVASRGPGIWLGALLQFAISSIFILAFGFPRIMIAILGAFILIGTALSLRVKPVAIPAARPPQPVVAHLVRFRILSVAAGLCAVACLCFLLFGFVTFMNSWTSWQKYNGASYHRADFWVRQVYYQRGSRGGVDMYANGTVEGQREWMTLQPYLQSYLEAMPKNLAELDEQVPPGTSIPIYLFPGMKGRARVRVYQEVPPAEAYHREAMNALRYGLGGLAICGGILFVLIRLRAGCFRENEAAFSATA
jgi:hypothetical protein